ncbi:monofunctional biosynthetic peptidoglycan transglycosylase [Methylocella silvestris BL2]|uniref:Biosynthetic peptidoglycan transglycosylase n=1 Tax=Methylocella silvestris (strain DSM 15510 / CIP 108128 / LMG 27833 / NCIMB 13906 / BL2) TaxID=395965 RepID=B8ER44_METSB|nr:monofunctional biosynthetic peptidoglycan transglycosylase [Methylocella silvestris]ACK49789.1 monofunctional biosynthetic peptidoglycan transglycosylase [Methylocella silvestris BL2]
MARSGPLGFLGKLFAIVLCLALALLLGVVGLIFAYRYVTPTSTLMLARYIQGKPVDRVFVPLNQISPNLRAAVIASEDSLFCRHHGVDWSALQEVIDSADEDGPARGASTITMQTAKNLFLWPSRSVIRKAIEIPLALIIDFLLPKRRVLEIYLNIAEWGEGLFGAEAAARRYFQKGADRLDARQAALMASALPNPRMRDPAHPSRQMTRRAATIAARLRDEDLSCVN